MRTINEYNLFRSVIPMIKILRNVEKHGFLVLQEFSTASKNGAAAGRGAFGF